MDISEKVTLSWVWAGLSVVGDVRAVCFDDGHSSRRRSHDDCDELGGLMLALGDMFLRWWWIGACCWIVKWDESTCEGMRTCLPRFLRTVQGGKETGGYFSFLRNQPFPPQETATSENKGVVRRRIGSSLRRDTYFSDTTARDLKCVLWFDRYGVIVIHSAIVLSLLANLGPITSHSLHKNEKGGLLQLLAAVGFKRSERELNFVEKICNAVRISL